VFIVTERVYCLLYRTVIHIACFFYSPGTVIIYSHL